MNEALDRYICSALLCVVYFVLIQSILPTYLPIYLNSVLNRVVNQVK